MEYELIKQLKGYILAEINDDKVEVKTLDLKGIREARDVKVVASTETIYGMDYAKLRIEDCNELFGVKNVRQPKVSEKYSDAKYGTLKELQGIQEIVRLQIYNYLTGRMTHKAFIQFYHEYETMLHDHGIIKLNEFNLNENEDDEYFNDNLNDPELQRELGEQLTTIIVTVSTLKGDDGYVIMFKK